MRFIFLVVIWASLLAGCVDDKDYAVTIGDIERVNHDALKGLTGEGLDWLESHTGGEYIRVPLSVSNDLVRYVFDNDVNVSVNYSFCDTPDVQSWIGLPDLYLSGKSLTDQIIFEGLNRSDIESRDPFGLELVLFSRWDGKQDKTYSESLPYDYKPYDLISEPQDVCFTIKAAGMISGVKSEIVKISKDKFK